MARVRFSIVCAATSAVLLSGCGDSADPATTGQVTAFAQPSASTVETGSPTSLETSDGTRFVITVEGEDIVASAGQETYPNQLHPDGGALATLIGEGRPVMFVPGWDLRSPAAARIGSEGINGAVQWIAPVDAAAVRLADGTPVVVLAIPTPGVMGGPPHLFGEAQPDGSVREVTRN